MKIEIWVVEHSKQQNQFHIDTLDSILKANLDAFLEDREATRDFVPLGVACSHDEATQLKDTLTEQRNKRRPQS